MTTETTPWISPGLTGCPLGDGGGHEEKGFRGMVWPWSSHEVEPCHASSDRSQALEVNAAQTDGREYFHHSHI